MWGSDWPVLTMVEKYENWFDIAQNLVSHLSDNEKKIFFLILQPIFINFNNKITKIFLKSNIVPITTIWK